MGAVIEIDVVTNLRANTDWSSKGLKSSTGIYREFGRSVGQADRVRKTGSRILVANAEVVESNFARDEDAEGPGTRLKLRAEKAMQSAELRIHQLGGHSIAESVGVGSLEVVGHFRLQLDAGMKVNRGSPSETDEIVARRRVTGAKIVSEDAYLNVIGMILRDDYWGGGGKNQ
jgi:hypothetical protein